MNPAEARREANRILRAASRSSIERDVLEAERLLRLAGGVEREDEVAVRRLLEHECLLNPEWFVALPE